jgi:hypothetical protein
MHEGSSQAVSLHHPAKHPVKQPGCSPHTRVNASTVQPHVQNVLKASRVQTRFKINTGPEGLQTACHKVPHMYNTYRAMLQ